MLTRTAVIEAMHDGFVDWEAAHALWEGGSAAFDRVDAWSDIDLQVAVDDVSTEAAIERAEQILASLSPIRDRYRVPEPAWHGLSQIFVRLEHAPPDMLVDLCVFKQSATQRFNETERHGTPRILFNKNGWYESGRLDRPTHEARLRARRDEIAARFQMFGGGPLKEVRRGRPLDALGMYHALLLRPLVELLRIRYDPDRYDFGFRYLHFDLPEDVAERLARLAYPADLEALAHACEEVHTWTTALLDTLP